MLRPIGREYQEIVALLARGKRRGVPKRLARLELTRQQLAARMTEIDDYLNWFEATQMNSGSGNFTGYLKAVDQSQVPAPKASRPALSLRRCIGGPVRKLGKPHNVILSEAKNLGSILDRFCPREMDRDVSLRST